MQIVTILFYILMTLGIIGIILKITNHSPTTEQVAITIVGGMFLLLIKNQFDLGYIKSDIKHLNKKINKVEHNLNTKIDKVEHNLNIKIDKIEENLKEHINLLRKDLT